jgi:peptide methionine sulfoxide reductase msrA/msrB
MRSWIVIPYLFPAVLACDGFAAPRVRPGQESAVRQTPAPIYSRSGHDVTPLAPEVVKELASRLDTESRRVTQEADTERPFCGLFHDHHDSGIYVCKVCGLPLFESRRKYDSGTGWPSFTTPVDPTHIAEREDRSHGMTRIETRCARCGAHLGHVFEDGPPPTGQRYCLNSLALEFLGEGSVLPEASQPVRARDAWFAGGCFWGVEDAFARLPGVMNAESGYAGGSLPEPTYDQVRTGRTSHAETVHVVYDPARLDYEELIRIFFQIHDPTTLHRQGPDVGTQYRSAIFTADEEQERMAWRVLRELQTEGAWRGHPFVTEIVPFQRFYRAEDYHQDYHARHGGSCRLP